MRALDFLCMPLPVIKTHRVHRRTAQRTYHVMQQHRRIHPAAHGDGDAFARELQVGQRAVDLLAANQLRDEIELLRRHAHHAQDRLGLVVAERARR